MKDIQISVKLAKHMARLQDTYLDNGQDVTTQRLNPIGIRSSQIKALVLYLIEEGVLK